MNQSTLSTTAMTILRVVLGVVFVAHGWQKFNQFTIAGTQASFAKMNVPLPELTAPLVATLELVGGIALILGVLTRIFAALFVLHMLGALVLVHARNGIFVSEGGFELVLVLSAAALVVALVGPGRYSVDHTLFGRSGSRLKVLA